MYAVEISFWDVDGEIHSETIPTQSRQEQVLLARDALKNGYFSVERDGFFNVIRARYVN